MKLQRPKANSLNDGCERLTSKKYKSKNNKLSKHKSSEHEKQKNENKSKLVNGYSKYNHQAKRTQKSKSTVMPSSTNEAKTGDTWVVIEIKMKSGRIRPLYYSIQEQIGYWDRPPFGYGQIISGKTVSPGAFSKSQSNC